MKCLFTNDEGIADTELPEITTQARLRTTSRTFYAVAPLLRFFMPLRTGRYETGDKNGDKHNAEDSFSYADGAAGRRGGRDIAVPDRRKRHKAEVYHIAIVQHTMLKVIWIKGYRLGIKYKQYFIDLRENHPDKKIDGDGATNFLWIYGCCAEYLPADQQT